MIRQNLFTAFKSIKRNALFSVINLLGQGIGLASVILIIQFVLNEINFDRFHKDFGSIYRVVHKLKTQDGTQTESAITFSRIAYELRQSYKPVEEVVRIHKIFRPVKVRFEDKFFFESKVIATDSNFFKIFNFPLISGDVQEALRRPHSILLSQTTAQKYFGDQNPIGQEIEMEGAYGFWSSEGLEDKVTYIVTGVLKDLPQNTHLDFDFLISLTLYSDLEQEMNNWGDDLYTYLKIPDFEKVSFVEQGLADIAKKYRPDQGVSLSLQKMQEIHLESNLLNEFKTNGSKSSIYLLSGIAILILLVASANYINFATASAINRQKEIAIRKIYWATKGHLLRQMLTESLVVNAGSLLLGLIVILAISPLLTGLLGFEIIDSIQTPVFWLTSFGIVSFASLLSGFYPALIISRLGYNGIATETRQTLKIGTQRKVLLALQFTICVSVIGCTLVLFSQMMFMRKQNLGLTIDNTLVLNGPLTDWTNDSIYSSQLYSFKTETARIPSILSVSSANFIPGKEINGKANGYVRKVGDQPDAGSTYYFTQVDYEFMKQFGIKVLAGRYFDRQFPSDKNGVIINKAACDLLGFGSPENAIGRKIVFKMETTPEVIGVIDDFHQQSFKRDFQPIIFEVSDQADSYFFAKVMPTQQPFDYNQLTSTWNSIFEDSPISFFDLREYYNQQYFSDQQFTTAFSYFALLAIFVASIGFLGLVYFLAVSKSKEIGIRKVMGARFTDILIVFAKGISVLTLGAGLLAIPIIYLVSNSWLQRYVFRISFSAWMFILPFVCLVMLAFLIVLFQTAASNRVNPVLTLREK